MSIEDKARRLLDEGRVRRVSRNVNADRFEVKGDLGTYTVRVFAVGKPSCTCEAGRFDRACSHALAAVKFRNAHPA